MSAPPKVPTLKRLARLSLAYGTADVLAQGINLLLLPLYTAYLSPADYGSLALLLLLSTFLKILFRLGLDSGFMRIHYDLKDAESRARFAGTTALFASAVAGTGFALFWLFSPLVSFTAVPMTFLARMAVVWPVVVGIGARSISEVSHLNGRSARGFRLGMLDSPPALLVFAATRGNKWWGT